MGTLKKIFIAFLAIASFSANAIGEVSIMTRHNQSVPALSTELINLSLELPRLEGQPYKLYILKISAGRFYSNDIVSWSYMGEFPDRKSCMKAGNVLSKYADRTRDIQEVYQISDTPFGCL